MHDDFVTPNIQLNCHQYTLHMVILFLIQSGYGLEDDQYNVYDQPWRKGGGSAANTIYRPKKDLYSELYGDNVEEYTKNKRFILLKLFCDPSQLIHFNVQIYLN